VENIFGPAESNLNWGLPQDYGGGKGILEKNRRKVVHEKCLSTYSISKFTETLY